MIKVEELPSLLKRDEGLIALANEINAFEKIYNQKVIEIKAACPHSELTETWEHPEKMWGSEKGALLKTECTQCGLVRRKPDRMPWDTCEKCWGKMESDGTGFVGEDRAHFYKCTKCSNTYYHT